MEQGVFLALKVTESLLDAELPWNRLKMSNEGGEVDALEEAAVSLVMSGDSWRGVPPGLAQLWQERSFTAKIGILWNRTFIPPEQLAVKHLVDPTSMKRYWAYLARIKDLLIQNRWIIGRRRKLESLIRHKVSMDRWLRDKR